MISWYTLPMNFFRRLFKKRVKKTLKELLKELSPGDMVHLKFKTPEQIGIVSGQELTLMRLNPGEASLREIKGTISSVRTMPAPLSTKVIEVVTYSSPSMPGKARQITFLEDEIEYVRRLDE